MAPNGGSMDKWIKALMALALALGITGATVALVDSDGDDKKDKIVLHIDGIDGDRKADDKLVLSKPAAEQLDKLESKTKGDLGDAELNQGDSPKPLVGPLATQSFPGCRTQFVRNMSSRNGSPIRVIVLHYTVSFDRGWLSNDALTAMSNNPANGVSWHFSIGRKTGTCSYNVPLTMKAWTQGNANPFAVGIEVVAFGNEGVYTEGAGRQRLIKTIRTIEQRTGVTNQRGKVVNCQPVRSGLVRHVDLGACGGGHHDTDPFPDPIPGLVRDVAAKQKVPLTALDQKQCRGVHKYRGRPRHTKQGTRLFRKRLDAQKRRGHKCVDGKAVQA